MEAAAREKTEKIISSELKKAANNPELHQRVQAIAPLSGVHSDDSALSAVVRIQFLYYFILNVSRNINIFDRYIQSKCFFQEDDDDVMQIEDDEPSCSTFNSNEHAYSYGL